VYLAISKSNACVRSHSQCCYSLASFWQVCIATHDRNHADKVLEDYITTTVMDVLMMFFSSPFSDQSTTLQVCFTTVQVSCGAEHNTTGVFHNSTGKLWCRAQHYRYVSQRYRYVVVPSTTLTHSLTAGLDQLRVVASSTSNDPGPRSGQH